MNLIREAIREGGWPIWLVLLASLALLYTAALYARKPDRERLALLIGFGVTTLLLGLLGTVLGVQISASHIREVHDNERWIFLIGLKESLQNLAVALLALVSASLLATFGSYRQARSRSSAPSVAQASSSL